MSSSALIRDVERIAGRGSILDAAAAAPFARADPTGVVAPPTPEALAAVLTWCSERGQPVLPAGAGTWLQPAITPLEPHSDPAAEARAEPRCATGQVPDPTGRATPRPLVISTLRLDGVLEHEPADLVVGTRAGTTHLSLAKQLSGHGQRLPLDPPTLAGATIGATISLGAAGPLRAGYGAPRDLVLGLEVATGDGRLLRFGGRVVKNVAGYDGVRLFTGSCGALGIITAAWLRVRSEPASDLTFEVPAEDERSAAALARRIADSTPADALEIVGPATFGTQAPERWRVLVRVSGSAEAVRAEQDRLAALVGGRQAVLNGAEATELWHRLGTDEAAAAMHITVQRPASALGETLGGTVSNLQSAKGIDRDGWRFAAHGGQGMVRAWRHDALSEQQESELLTRLRDLIFGTVQDESSATSAAASAGGTVVCRFGAGRPARVLARPVQSRQGAESIRRRLAAAFDPAGILVGSARFRSPAADDRVEDISA